MLLQLCIFPLLLFDLHAPTRMHLYVSSVPSWRYEVLGMKWMYTLIATLFFKSLSIIGINELASIQ